jgi:threonine/homoserine efflux transporter RhtA
MRGSAIVQLVILAAVAAGLGYLVIESADGWADWVVFGVVVCAAIGATIAIWNRQYPAATKKRTFTRDSESDW